MEDKENKREAETAGSQHTGRVILVVMAGLLIFVIALQVC